MELKQDKVYIAIIDNELRIYFYENSKWWGANIEYLKDRRHKYIWGVDFNLNADCPKLSDKYKIEEYPIEVLYKTIELIDKIKNESNYYTDRTSSKESDIIYLLLIKAREYVR